MDDNKPHILSDFLLDGAKIIFASLVVGVFVPGASGGLPWLTFIAGIIMTVLFLGIAQKAYKMEHET